MESRLWLCVVMASLVGGSLRTAEQARASLLIGLFGSIRKMKAQSLDCAEYEQINICSFQATKSQRWMPWHQEPMKDVSDCEKLRGAVD
jgi:hypothetical protein